jgi:hypothetical protein
MREANNAYGLQQEINEAMAAREVVVRTLGTHEVEEADER